MRTFPILPAVLALAGLTGCVYEEPHHYAAYSYATPGYDYPPPPPPGIVVYEDDAGWYDQGGRTRNW